MARISIAPVFAVSTLVLSATFSVASVVGSSSASVAQSSAQSTSTASSGALLGVQERSVKMSSQTPTAPRSSQNQPLNSTSVPLQLYQFDRNTRVIMAPVRGVNTDPMEIPVAGSTGDNRIQLQYDLQP